MTDEPRTATDLVVETTFTADGLDELVQQLGPAVVVEGSYSASTRTCTVRVFGDPGFIKFALKNQGYGRVLSESVVGVRVEGTDD